MKVATCLAHAAGYTLDDAIVVFFVFYLAFAYLLFSPLLDYLMQIPTPIAEADRLIRQRAHTRLKTKKSDR
jgi:hypothetical protein